MIIIKGKSNKLAKVEELLKYRNKERVLIVKLDSLNLVSLGDCAFVSYESADKMFEDFINDELYAEFIEEAKEFNIVVFYTLDTDMNIDAYGAIERDLGREVIVCIQKDCETVVFEV